MKFARLVFLIAGIYGLIVLLPMYFLEERTGQDSPPPITHVEYYYGFIGVAVAWQIVFLILSRNPVRYRPMMIPAIVEKASFGIAVMVLYLQHRVSNFTVGAALVDSTLGVLFCRGLSENKEPGGLTSIERTEVPQRGRCPSSYIGLRKCAVASS